MSVGPFTVKFRGVRGGYPMPGPTTANVGGNTTCFEIRVAGHIIIVDAGTGIISLGQEMMIHHRATGEPLRVTLLITHTHHDHIQGFPFFLPARQAGCTLDIFAPRLLEENLLEVLLARAMAPPVFPLGLEELNSQRRIRHIGQGDLIVLTDLNAPPQLLGLRDNREQVPPDAVTVRVHHSLNHPGGVLIFRINYLERSVVVATDTEGYIGGDRRLMRFAKGTDLLIHDAEYDEDEYADQAVIRQGWGHSTWRMATDVALAAGVKQLALFHHSPGHDDAFLEAMERKAQAVFPTAFIAREGMTVEL